MKQMKKIAAAVSFGLVAGVAAQGAQAESLLFPYFNVNTGVYSFLSLTNADAVAATSFTAIGTAPNLHYVWNVKDDPANPVGNCSHSDLWGGMTMNDRIVQGVTDPTMGGLDLPALIGDKSMPRYLARASGQGFMTVSNFTTGAANSAESTLLGQMIVVDTTTGLVGAYKGMNGTLNTDGQFGAAADVGYIAKTTVVPSWYPTAESGGKLGASGVTTKWVYTVVGSNMSDINWKEAAALNNAFAAPGYAFNHDEDAISGSKTAVIVCQATLDRSAFLTTEQVNLTKNGGWTAVASTIGSYNALSNTFTAVPYNGATPTVVGSNARGVNVFKVEMSTALHATAISSENDLPNTAY